MPPEPGLVPREQALVPPEQVLVPPESILQILVPSLKSFSKSAPLCACTIRKIASYNNNVSSRLPGTHVIFPWIFNQKIDYDVKQKGSML